MPSAARPAVWEYDDMAAFERIDAAVRADPDSAKAQHRRNALGQLFTEMPDVRPLHRPGHTPPNPTLPAKAGIHLV